MRYPLALLTLAALVGCDDAKGPTQKQSAESPPAVEAPENEADAPESIGSARLKEDGTLVLQLRAEGPAGQTGDALRIYKPSDPKYQRTLDHIGGLEPGESKPVPPWPAAPDQP